MMAPKNSPALDRIDIKILAALQRDGRSTNEKLGRHRGAVAARMPGTRAPP